MPPRNFNLILFAVVTSILCHVTYRNTRSASILGEAIELIEQNYVDSVDRDELVLAAMEGVVSKLDEHSSYFAVEAYESFQDSMHQEFAGIGIFVDQPVEGEPVRVVTPLVGSPALRAGVMPNDRIVKVDGKDVTAMPLPEVSDRLKGQPGTKVLIEVLRGENDERQLMTVVRDTIELKSVVGDHRNEANEWVYRLKSQPSIAYMRLKSFGEKTVRELEAVIRSLDDDYDAMVLDLRGNGGGLLYAARDVSDMFLSKGQIVSTRIRDGSVDESYSATAGTLIDPAKPLVVLIDGNSASASEIVAACLQDNRRALIVGTRSYGKGTVQEVVPLQYGKSALRLTVARYYRPNNHNIHRSKEATDEDEWGVTPDPGYVVPMSDTEILTLASRWRKASFPMLSGIDPPSDLTPIVGSDETNEEIIETLDGPATDPVLELEEIVEPEVEEESEFAVELSEAAKANVSRGPESLSDDPPLRAAVGRLLELTQEKSLGVGGSGAPVTEKSKKPAA